MLSPAADFERAKILIPIAIRGFWLRFSPQFQLVEILSGDLTLPKSIKEMITESGRKVSPLDLPHSFSKSHSGKLFLQFLLFFRVC